MPPRKSISLSNLFTEACKQLELATEQAMGCERIGSQLIVHVTDERKVVCELVDDEETGNVGLGNIVE